MDWDDAYNNRGHIAEAESYPPRWAAEAAAMRERVAAAGRARLDIAYGAAPRDMTESLDLIATGRVCVPDLITHRFQLSGFSEALDLAANPRGTSLKVIVDPQAG